MTYKALFLNVILSTSAVASVDWGNGGDALYCAEEPGASFVGTYFLDFVVTYSPAEPPQSPSSLEASLIRIASLLAEKKPNLATGFQVFVEDLFNEVDFTRPHVWERSHFGVAEIEDEELASQLPSNCTRKVQAVQRQPAEVSGRPAGTWLYLYDETVFFDLAETGALQTSMLVVHEWLWHLSDDVAKNRQINLYLHSADFEVDSSAVVGERIDL